MTSPSAVDDRPLPEAPAPEDSAPMADDPVDGVIGWEGHPPPAAPGHLTITLEIHCEPASGRDATRAPMRWPTAVEDSSPVARLAEGIRGNGGAIHLRAVIPERWMIGIEEWAGTRIGSKSSTEGFGLTRRQWDVAQLLAQGLSNAQIANTLGISPHTARRHTERVLRKLALNSRAQVATKVHGQHGHPPLDSIGVFGMSSHPQPVGLPAHRMPLADQPPSDPD